MFFHKDAFITLKAKIIWRFLESRQKKADPYWTSFFNRNTGVKLVIGLMRILKRIRMCIINSCYSIIRWRKTR